MAERVVGLRIELNGFKGVVSNIKELENEIRKAKEDLQELEIGGDLFKQLTGEISRAEGQLMKLQDASKGIGLEKQLEGYGKLAGGITSSFAAAQAAVQLFGVESESVSKAAAQAQNILTLALSARGIQEVGVGASIVARTIAEKAATAATAASNTALKALYATIAANPIGALVTAVGLLVTAVIAFNSESEKSLDVQKELGKVTSDEANKLEIYTAVLKDANSTNEARKQAIDELKKTYPGFNALIDDENRLTEEGIKWTELKIQSLVKEAQAKMLVAKIAENNNKLLEIENRTVEESIGWTDKLLGSLGKLYYGDYAKGYIETTAAIENNSKETNKLTQENDKLTAALKDILTQQGNLNTQLAPTNKKLDDQAKSEKNLTKNTTDANKATDAQVKAQKMLEGQLASTNKEFESYLASVTKLIEGAKEVDAPTSQFLETLQGILQTEQELVKLPIEKIFKDLGLSVKVVNNELTIENDRLEKFSDTFYKFYVDRRDQLLDIVKLPTDQFSTEINKIIDEAASMVKTTEELEKGAVGITAQAFEAFRGIAEQYTALNKLIRQDKPPYEEVFGGSSKLLNEFLDLTNLVAISQGKLAVEYGKNIYNVENLADNTRDLYIQEEGGLVTLKTSTQLLKERDDLLNQISIKLTDYYTKLATAEDAEFDKLKKNYKLTKDQEDELVEARKKGGEELKELIKKIVETQVEGIKSISTQIQQTEGEINNINQQSLKVFEDAAALSSEARKKLLLENLEAVYDYTQREKAIVIDTKKSENQQQEQLAIDLNNKLSKLGIDFTKLTEEEKLKLLEFYLQKQVQATEKAEKKKRDEQKVTLEDVQKGLQIISQALSDVAAIAAQNFQLQLDILKYNYEQDMENIVGQTEEANAKRIELEKIYQAERKKLEKEAQLTALKFTLAQAVAQGAQAVINALATLPPPANAIVAGVQGIITAAQIAVIAKQINFVQSTMRRGGVLKSYAGGGGLATGPSHEQGGIYAGGGSYIEGNEAIINRQSSLQYAPLLSQINQAGGGRPIVVSSPMDSRLMEALAKQKTEPIRAYVVEQDITRAQTINRRLEQLASF